MFTTLIEPYLLHRGLDPHIYSDQNPIG